MSRFIGLILGILLVAGGFFLYFEKGADVKRAWTHMISGHEAPSTAAPEIVVPEKTVPGQITVPEAPVVAAVTEASPVPETPVLPPDVSSPMPEMKTQASSSVDNPGETVETPRYRQIFWRPFRTRISAKGFANRVQEITDLNVEVMERGPTEFVVAFPYGDESERKAGLALIRERTRMEVDGDEG